jgi:hypothetical protein
MSNPLNAVINYFDLQAKWRGTPAAQGGGQDLSVMPQYAALVLGVLVQPFFEHFRTTGEWNVNMASLLKWGAFALLVGLIIFPSVYRKAFDPGQPKFVQFCVIFVAIR